MIRQKTLWVQQFNPSHYCCRWRVFSKTAETRALLCKSFCIAVTFLVFLSVARFFVIDRTVLPYVYPLAAFGLTLAAIFNFEIAAFFSVIIGIMTAYSTPNGFDLSVFYILASILGILALGNARRIGAFFLSGITVGLAGVAIILSFRLPGSLTDWIGITMLSGASLINGIAAAGVTLLLQFIFSLPGYDNSAPIAGDIPP